MKVTAVAPTNIAFIKYWGARNLEAAIPFNPSISMTLTRCVSRCTAEHREDDSGPDEVLVRSPGGGLGRPAPEFARRIREHLSRIRGSFGRAGAFHVATENSFPSAAGLASSASGFAGLTLAATGALGIELDPAVLSSLARQSGSGSAARSVLGGYVEWPAGEGEERSYALPLAPATHWDLRNVIALVDSAPKPVSSREGHRRATTSPFFGRRQEILPSRLRTVREAIAARDLDRLGPLLEEEAIELHLVAMSSRPPILYWRPGTLRVLEAVRELRARGVAAWATMDAGPNVHVICPPDSEEQVARALNRLPEVEGLIRDRVGDGPQLVAEHLF